MHVSNLHWATWAEWEKIFALRAGEDLSQVLRHVRAHATSATRARWSNDWRSQTFCNLALHLLHEKITARGGTTEAIDGERIFVDLKPVDLERHAAVMIENPESADALHVQRFNDTWGHQGAFSADLISYLLRPAPYMHRLDVLFPAIEAAAPTLTLGEFVQHAALMELTSKLDDKLVTLHCAIIPTLPRHSAAQGKVAALRDQRLLRWTAFYGQVFPRYGLDIKEGKDWKDLARKIVMASLGLYQRSIGKNRDPWECDDMTCFSELILDLLSVFFDVKRSGIDGFRYS